jgi:hypothetical protein
MAGPVVVRRSETGSRPIYASADADQPASHGIGAAAAPRSIRRATIPASLADPAIDPARTPPKNLFSADQRRSIADP